MTRLASVVCAAAVALGAAAGPTRAQAQPHPRTALYLTDIALESDSRDIPTLDVESRLKR